MIRDLDDTIAAFLKALAPAGSELAGADITFDIPDAKWRSRITKLTVNCYLYDIRENRGMRTNETLTVYSPDRSKSARIRPPVRIDCGYCITTWSTASTDPVLEEHRLLSQVLLVLLQNETIPAAYLQGTLQTQIPPYPTVIASQEGVKNLPEFWNALDQRLKPSLNYVVALAMMIDAIPADSALSASVATYTVQTDQKTP